MAESTSSEEVALWQRRLASQANNRAWQLSESATRSAMDDEDMLQAAHAAMFFWKIVGDASNRAHAAQLVAHVYALLKLPDPARYYFAKAEAYFREPDRKPWERALVAAVEANIAAASAQPDAHRRCYELATLLIEELADPEDRQVLQATLRAIPKPELSRAA